MDLSNVDEDLIGILKNTSLSTETRVQGWNYILGLTAASVGVRHIINSGKYLPYILSFVTRDNKTASEDEVMKLAFKTLINISSEEPGTLSIVNCRKDILNYLLNDICDPDSRFVSFKCYILSNMSTCPEVLEKILHILLSSKGLYERLVKVYCPAESKEPRSQYDFLTLLFANISRLPAGRRLLLQDSDFMSNIKCIEPSQPENRRLGAALILRNCCLEIDLHEKLLNDGILHALLLPLMVPQQYEEGEMGKLPPELQQRCLSEIKERDKSASVRRVLVEALTVFCYSEIGWTTLKCEGAYYVVRDLHLWEQDRVVKEVVEQLVAYLLVVEYSSPTATLNDSYSDRDTELIKQVEADLVRDLPDLIVNDT